MVLLARAGAGWIFKSGLCCRKAWASARSAEVQGHLLASSQASGAGGGRSFFVLQFPAGNSGGSLPSSTSRRYNDVKGWEESVSWTWLKRKAGGS